MSARKSNISIVDYGIGNLFNVRRSFESVGADTQIAQTPEEILSADRLVIPGVGAFEKGMQGLSSRSLVEPIREFVKTGKPLMGICLGMQLLLTESEELGLHKGLDIVQGKSIKLKTEMNGTETLKIPQMGWNSLSKAPNARAWNGTILSNIEEGSFVYFLHSYFVTLVRKDDELAYSEYGPNRFCSVFRRDNVTGIQPHPERSGKIGMAILKNFTIQ